MKKSNFTLISLCVSLIFLMSTKVFGTCNSRFCAIDGKFFHAIKVDYSIYEIAPDSSLCFVQQGIKLKIFYIKLRTNHNYLIRFTSNKGVVKYMQIETKAAGRYPINIDFSKDLCAILAFDNRVVAYNIKPVNKSDIYFAGKE